MKKIFARFLISILLFAAFGTVSAGEIEVRNAWVRSAPDVARVTAGFATLVNHGKQSDVLVGVSAKFARSTSLHATQTESGMVHMIPRDSIVLPAGEKVSLSPGGLHIMFSQLEHEALVVGGKIDLVFHFEHAGLVEVHAAVRGVREMAQHHMHH